MMVIEVNKMKKWFVVLGIWFVVSVSMVCSNAKSTIDFEIIYDSQTKTTFPLKEAIEQNPDAKAILVNNPTYYGICSDIRSIVKLAHEKNMLVLADEAHGTHLSFGENLPVSAMAAGADMSSVSMHKSGGSLTQSSILLTGKNINADYMRQIINLTQTTSGSYLLLSSLDLSRRNLSKNGKEIFAKVCEMAQYARNEINNIRDYYAFSEELVNGDSIYAFDNKGFL